MAEVPRWRLTGDWFDVCRCRVPCGCTFAQAPDEGECNGMLTWHVRKGNYGDVRLDGLNVGGGPLWSEHLGRRGHQLGNGILHRRTSRRGPAPGLSDGLGGQAGAWPAGFAETSCAGEFARIVRIEGVIDIHAEAIVGSNEDEDAEPVKPPFWKGAPYTTTFGRGQRYSNKDFNFGWEATGKACSFSQCHNEEP